MCGCRRHRTAKHATKGLAGVSEAKGHGDSSAGSDQESVALEADRPGLSLLFAACISSTRRRPLGLSLVRARLLGDGEES